MVPVVEGGRHQGPPLSWLASRPGPAIGSAARRRGISARWVAGGGTGRWRPTDPHQAERAPASRVGIPCPTPAPYTGTAGAWAAFRVRGGSATGGPGAGLAHTTQRHGASRGLVGCTPAPGFRCGCTSRALGFSGLLGRRGCSRAVLCAPMGWADQVRVPLLFCFLRASCVGISPTWVQCAPRLSHQGNRRARVLAPRCNVAAGPALRSSWR